MYIYAILEDTPFSLPRTAEHLLHSFLLSSSNLPQVPCNSNAGKLLAIPVLLEWMMYMYRYLFSNVFLDRTVLEMCVFAYSGLQAVREAEESAH